PCPVAVYQRGRDDRYPGKGDHLPPGRLRMTFVQLLQTTTHQADAGCGCAGAAFRTCAWNVGLSAPGSAGREAPSTGRIRLNGAAPESNRPSVGLPHRTGFEVLRGWATGSRTNAGIGESTRGRATFLATIKKALTRVEPSAHHFIVFCADPLRF